MSNPPHIPLIKVLPSNALKLIKHAIENDNSKAALPLIDDLINHFEKVESELYKQVEDSDQDEQTT